MGVTRVQTAGGVVKFRARIGLNGKRHNLGFHKTQAEAMRAIEEFLDCEGIPYEETAFGQLRKEREERRKREATALLEEEAWQASQPVKRSFISRLLSKLRR